MTRKTYIKHNSHTQKACRDSSNIVDNIISAAGVTKDEWLQLLFESGCQFIEQKVDSKEIQLQILTNIKHGFWSWWICAFIRDDEELFAAIQAGFEIDYSQLKMDMHSYIKVEGLEDFFIKENTLNL